MSTHQEHITFLTEAKTKYLECCTLPNDQSTKEIFVTKFLFSSNARDKLQLEDWVNASLREQNLANLQANVATPVKQANTIVKTIEFEARKILEQSGSEYKKNVIDGSTQFNPLASNFDKIAVHFEAHIAVINSLSRILSDTSKKFSQEEKDIYTAISITLIPKTQEFHREFKDNVDAVARSAQVLIGSMNSSSSSSSSAVPIYSAAAEPEISTKSLYDTNESDIENLETSSSSSSSNSEPQPEQPIVSVKSRAAQLANVLNPGRVPAGTFSHQNRDLQTTTQEPDQTDKEGCRIC